MGGRGMTIVLVPDLGGKLIEGFPGHIAVLGLQRVDPDYEFVPLAFRQRKEVEFHNSRLVLLLPRHDERKHQEVLLE